MADNREKRADLSGSRAKADHIDYPRASQAGTAVGQQDGVGPSDDTRRRLEASVKLENPLAGMSHEQLANMAGSYCREHNITDEEDVRAFRLGAIIAGNRNSFDGLSELTERERQVLEEEITHKWRNPRMLYFVVAVCSLCAAIQGMGASRSRAAVVLSPRELRLTLDQTRLSSTAPSPSTNTSLGSPRRAAETPGFWD